jgi:hypothetical protein
MNNREKELLEARGWLTALNTLLLSNVPDVICWENRSKLETIRDNVKKLQSIVDSCIDNGEKVN